MKPVSPVIPDQNMPEVVVAEHQDEYQDLPAIRLEGGIILCRWKLDEAERKRVAETGDIYLLQWTGDGLVTPMLLQTEPPSINAPEPEKVTAMTAMRRTAAIVNQAKELGFELFDDNCSECGHVVVYTGATVETLKNSPETKIVCKVCFDGMRELNPEMEGVYLPNTNHEVLEIVKKYPMGPTPVASKV